MSDWKPEKGEYAMHHMFEKDDNGTLVFICSEKDGCFGIEYVPSGGSSFSWPAKEFRPVTDPVLIAVTKAHKAEQEARDYEIKARRLKGDAQKWYGVVKCLRESQKAVQADAEKIQPHQDCYYFGGCGCNNIRLDVKPHVR